MNRIKILNEDTANKIAAGEVVEGPLSVVKELVENSIDAGSTKIEIELKSGGKNLIRVSDDGCGMSRDDAVLTLERHSTSKISSHQDLSTVATMGFRGEAIPSIASVSRFTITTCEKESASDVPAESELVASQAVPQNKAIVGTFVKVDGGKLINVLDVGRSFGTTVEIKNLFFNVPARRKYMRSVERETSDILRTVQNYAVACPQIYFSIIHNDKTLLLAPSASTLEDRLATIFGKTFLPQMIPVDSKGVGLNISGFISKPAFTRSNRLSQMLFVNRRPIKSLPISYAVAAGYRTLLPKGRYPLFVLFIEIDPEEIDVNVHPTKREIRFRNEWGVKENVTGAVSRALKGQELAPVAEFPAVDKKPNTDSISVPEPKTAPSDFEKRLAASTEKTFQFRPQEQSKLAIDKPVEETKGSETKPVVGSKPAPKLKSEMKFLAQLKNSYILAETNEGLAILDQHAAHERVLYERFTNVVLNNSREESQGLLIPQTLELPPSDSIIFEKSLTVLQQIGFNVRSFGKNTFIIDGVPAYLPSSSIEETIHNILAYIHDNRSDFSSNKDKTVIRSACRASVMARESLQPEECRQLLKDLFLCENPYTCPHGRPTIIKMPFVKLQKEFKRK